MAPVRSNHYLIATMTAVLATGVFVLSVNGQEWKGAAFAQFDQQVRDLVRQMTLDEKIGQMTQADQEFLKDPADIKNLFLGSVLSGGNSDPKEGNSRRAWAAMYQRYQQYCAQDEASYPAPLRRRRGARA